MTFEDFCFPHFEFKDPAIILFLSFCLDVNAWKKDILQRNNSMAIKSDWDKKPLQQNLHGTTTIAEYNYKCIIWFTLD